MKNISINRILLFCIIIYFSSSIGYCWDSDTLGKEDAKNDQQQEIASTKEDIDNNLTEQKSINDIAVSSDSDSLNLLIQQAEQGDIQAQFNLGMRYCKGIGVAKNCKNAFIWLKKAAEQGHSSAQVLLGTMYDSGEGVERNKQEAFKWYKKTCQTGSCHASDGQR